MRLPALSLLVLLSGCLPARFPPPAGATAAPSPAPATLERGAYSGVTAARTVVVRDRAAFAELLEQVSIGRAPDARPPRVDFTSDMVLGVFLGTRRTGGYAAEIIAVEILADEVRVRWRETGPPSGAMVTQALTAPYHLVHCARSDLPVRFVRE